MNERIKQLALQAGLAVDVSDYTKFGFGPGDAMMPYPIAPELDKFAKLIIQECVEVCKSRVSNSDYNTGRMHCASDLEEHFGVEE